MGKDIESKIKELESTISAMEAALAVGGLNEANARVMRDAIRKNEAELEELLARKSAQKKKKSSSSLNIRVLYPDYDNMTPSQQEKALESARSSLPPSVKIITSNPNIKKASKAAENDFIMALSTLLHNTISYDERVGNKKDIYDVNRLYLQLLNNPTAKRYISAVGPLEAKKRIMYSLLRRGFSRVPGTDSLVTNVPMEELNEHNYVYKNMLDFVLNHERELRRIYPQYYRERKDLTEENIKKWYDILSEHIMINNPESDLLDDVREINMLGDFVDVRDANDFNKRMRSLLANTIRENLGSVDKFDINDIDSINLLYDIINHDIDVDMRDPLKSRDLSKLLIYIPGMVKGPFAETFVAKTQEPTLKVYKDIIGNGVEANQLVGGGGIVPLLSEISGIKHRVDSIGETTPKDVQDKMIKLYKDLFSAAYITPEYDNNGKMTKNQRLKELLYRNEINVPVAYKSNKEMLKFFEKLYNKIKPRSIDSKDDRALKQSMRDKIESIVNENRNWYDEFSKAEDEKNRADQLELGLEREVGSVYFNDAVAVAKVVEIEPSVVDPRLLSGKRITTSDLRDIKENILRKRAELESTSSSPEELERLSKAYDIVETALEGGKLTL